jgi:CHAD domain-containing protein
MKKRYFDLPPGWQLDDVVRALRDAYPIHGDPRVTEHAVYYDTFDWRLFNKSLTVAYTPPHARLYALPDERLVSQTDTTTPPLQLRDLPRGELRTHLAPILGVRALLPLFDLTSRYQPLRLVDERDKTVLRLTVEQHTLGPNRETSPLVSRVCLHPLKGYGKDAKKLRRWLDQQTFTPCHDTLYELALSAVAKVPNDYDTKLRLQLDPSQRADETTKQILRVLFRVMRCNEAGIIDDIDTEFLHDFRVAIRRTRSALSQIKGVFPAPVTQRFRTHFAWLGSMTNRVRDLDVYLLKEESYKAKLPEPQRDAIDPLFTMLRRERARAHATLVRQLHTRKYQDILERWETFLSAPCDAAPDAAPSALRPILKLARKRIQKKGRAVVDLGMSLHGSHEEKELHALRIECKKIRYLLEFFDSLFPEDEITAIVKQLRKLQDNLGDFHDLCVQQADLHTFAERFDTSKPHAPDVLLAIGGLINILEAEKITVGEKFPDIFADFVTSYRKVTL